MTDNLIHGYELNVEQPASFWLQPLQTDPKVFFVSLSLATLKGAAFKVDEALEKLGEAFLASGLQDKPGAAAWLLIYRSLLRAVADLVQDSGDLLAFADNPADESKQHELAGILQDNLQHCAVTITVEFFVRPQHFAFLEAFKPGLRHWLRGLGLEDLQAEALAVRLPQRFVLALHTEWLREPERYVVIQSAVDTPFTAAVGQQRQWLRYHAWLREQVNGRMFAEAFSLQQVYVRLRAYYQEKVDGLADDELPHEVRQNKKQRRVVCLHTALKRWLQGYNAQDTVRVVSGGPGSGKSSFAKLFAAEMAEQLGIPVLFVPLHQFEPEANLITAVENFVKSNRYLAGSPLDATVGEERLLVIFDGLDELAMQGKAAAEVAQGFVDEVLRRSEAFSAQGLQRRFLLTGRDLAVQANISKFRGACQVLHVLPYFVDEEARKREEERYVDPDALLAIDQRNDWWCRYGNVKGKEFATMPAELQQANLTEITAQPLLNYLVSLSHDRGQLDFQQQTTLNAIYQDLLGAVYARQWEGGRRHSGTGDLTQENFFRILEEIALAVWHGDGRTATVDYIYGRCKRSSLVRYLEAFQEGAQKGVPRLLTAFYFRQAGEVKGEKTFEFTHKSFGEYLTARRLVRMLEKVQKMLERHAEDPDDGWDEREALVHWAEVCGPMAIDKYLYGFVKNEVALRRSADWQAWQKTVCRLIESAVTHGMPMEKLELKTFQMMLQQSRNAEEALLAMHFACARLTKEVLEIRWPSNSAFFGTWLWRLQEAQVKRDSLVLNCLGYLNLQGCFLYFQDFYEVNFSGANLSRANLSQADLSGANLSGVDLSGADLSRAYLSGADLSGADLSGADLSRAYLSRANLSGADLSRAYLSGADLSGANLSRANLSRAELLQADLWGADLSGAELLEAELLEANLSGAHLRYARNLEKARNLATAILPNDKLPKDFELPKAKTKDEQE